MPLPSPFDPARAQRTFDALAEHGVTPTAADRPVRNGVAMNRLAKIGFCVVLLGALAGCSIVPEPVSRRADLVVVGRVTAALEVGLLPPADPDQVFEGYIYTFRTIDPNGALGATVQFVGPPACPSKTPGDQVYLVFLNRRANWLVVGYEKAPFQGKASDVLFLYGCTPMDEKSSVGLMGYYGPPWF